MVAYMYVSSHMVVSGDHDHDLRNNAQRRDGIQNDVLNDRASDLALGSQTMDQLFSEALDLFDSEYVCSKKVEDVGARFSLYVDPMPAALTAAQFVDPMPAAVTAVPMQESF